MVPLRTIDPAELDASDLEPIAAHLERARVVALGEATHGDGTAFLAKARLIVFLHERLGFDVLAWESGMFDCDEMARLSQTGTAPDTAMAAGLWAMWARSAEVHRLFDALAHTRRPLEMTGFDIQPSGKNTGAALGPWLIDFFDAAQLLGSDRRRRIEEAAARLPVGAYRAATPTERAADEALVTELLALMRDSEPSLERAHGSARVARARRYLQNLSALYAWRAFRETTSDVPLDRRPGDNNLRDAAMAENVLWLAEQRFPGRKIILWLANFHGMREPTGVDPAADRYRGFVTMGQRLAEALGDAYYAVGFTAYQGEWGRAGELPSRIPAAAPGSLEAKLSETGHPFLFVHFGRAHAADRLESGHARFLGHASMYGVWDRVFDGAMFVKETKASVGAAQP